MADITNYINQIRNAYKGDVVKQNIVYALEALNGGSDRFANHGQLASGSLNNLYGHGSLGVYWLAGSRSYSNAPSEIAGRQCVLTVLSWTDTYAKQIIEIITTDPNLITKRYVRSRISSVWGSWYTE